MVNSKVCINDSESIRRAPSRNFPGKYVATLQYRFRRISDVPQIQHADGGCNDRQHIPSEGYCRCALKACANQEGRKNIRTHTMDSTVQRGFWRYAVIDVDQAQAAKMQSHRNRTSPITKYVIISFRPCAQTVRAEKTLC